MPDTAFSIRERTARLQQDWRQRAEAMQKWYRLVQLFNDLHQENMESVISSDPRTSYNMALWLLTPRTGSFVIDTEGWTEPELIAASAVQGYADRQFRHVNQQSRVSLFGSFQTHLLKLMLSTGWYAFVALPVRDGWHMEVWNPAQVFPSFNSDRELVEVARIYTVSADQANQKVVQGGWQAPSRPWFGPVNVHTHWRLRNGVVEHAVVMGTHLAKPYEPTGFRRIPVYTGPISGLPDDGSIMGGQDWKADIGQALIAPIADLTKNYDKMLTYMQQLLRDTANPRWVEKTQQGGVLTPEKLYARGAIFSIGIDEEVGPLQTPSIPGEMRTHQFDLRAQLQRAAFSDISFGSAVGNVSAFMMSNVTASSRQILDPYRDAFMAVLGQAATDMLDYQRQNGVGMSPWPVELPEHVTLNYAYDIQIPGDFLQRANSARILNPNFRISNQTLTEILLPEIQTFVEERGKLQAEDAVRHPGFQRLIIAQELRRAAQEATQLGDTEFAQNILSVIEQLRTEGASGDTGVPDAALGGGMAPSLDEILRS